MSIPQWHLQFSNLNIVVRRNPNLLQNREISPYFFKFLIANTFFTVAQLVLISWNKMYNGVRIRECSWKSEINTSWWEGKGIQFSLYSKGIRRIHIHKIKYAVKGYLKLIFVPVQIVPDQDQAFISIERIFLMKFSLEKGR